MKRTILLLAISVIAKSALAQKTSIEVGPNYSLFTKGSETAIGGRFGVLHQFHPLLKAGFATEVLFLDKAQRTLAPLFADFRITPSTNFNIAVQPGYSFYNYESTTSTSNPSTKTEIKTSGNFYIGGAITGYLPIGKIQLYAQAKYSQFSFNTNVKTTTAAGSRSYSQADNNGAITLNVGIVL